MGKILISSIVRKLSPPCNYKKLILKLCIILHINLNLNELFFMVRMKEESKAEEPMERKLKNQPVGASKK